MAANGIIKGEVTHMPIRIAMNVRLAGCTALLAALFAALPAIGQPAPKPVPGSELDDKPPLPRKPAKEPDLPEKYRIDATTAQFRAIEDENPLRSERENADEYRSWNDVLQHARQFPVAELEKVAERHLTSEDLIQESRSNFKLKPIRFEGQLKAVQRLDPTKALKELGFKDTYQATLTPTDEPLAHELCIVFSDLPPGIENIEQLKDRWVSFAGYFFKVIREEPANSKLVPPSEWKKLPLLIGQSVTLLPGPTAPEGDSAATIPNKKLRIFALIRDDAPIASEDSNWPEVAAFSWLALYARKFPAETLEEQAVKQKITFADLFEEGRSDYKLDLIRFQGRLIRVREDKAPRRMREAGVSKYYEAWLVPADEPRGNPLCVILTELPEGLEPAMSMNKSVSFAGYSFKLLRYKSGEQDQKQSYVWKRAPLLIGRTVTLLPDSTPYEGGTWGTVFVPMFLICAALILGTAGILSWWFRRGDAKVKHALAERQSNPFGN